MTFTNGSVNSLWSDYGFHSGFPHYASTQTDTARLPGWVPSWAAIREGAALFGFRLWLGLTLVNKLSRFICGSLQAAGRNDCAHLLSVRAASAAGGNKQRVKLIAGRKSVRAAQKQNWTIWTEAFPATPDFNPFFCIRLSAFNHLHPNSADITSPSLERLCIFSEERSAGGREGRSKKGRWKWTEREDWFDLTAGAVK